MRACLRRATLRFEIHVHDAETLRVAQRPLQVIEQGPCKVAAHVTTGIEEKKKAYNAGREAGAEAFRAVQRLLKTRGVLSIDKAGNGYTLTAKFNKIDGISAGSDVRLAGVKVGTVTGVALDRFGLKAE